MLTIERADRFASELTRLCKRYRVMIWNQYKNAPIMLSHADEDTEFHYVSRPSPPTACTIERVLGE